MKQIFVLIVSVILSCLCLMVSKGIVAPANTDAALFAESSGNVSEINTPGESLHSKREGISWSKKEAVAQAPGYLPGANATVTQFRWYDSQGNFLYESEKFFGSMTEEEREEIAYEILIKKVIPIDKRGDVAFNKNRK